MIKKIFSALAALAIVGVGAVSLAGPASADGEKSGECVPSAVVPAVADTYKDVPNPDYVPEVPGTPAIPGVPAVTERVNYNWTGGPVESAPAIDADGWHVNQGNHNGNPFDQPDGVPFQVGQGNGDWFLWKTIIVTPAIAEIPAVPGIPANGTPTIRVIDVPGTPGKDAVVCEPETDIDFVTVAWRMDGWINTTTPVWGDGQEYVTHEETDEANINILDEDLAPGCYQIDVYFDTETTDSLIAGGVLYGPGRPDEDLIPGSWGVAYKLLKIGEGDCNPRVIPQRPEPVRVPETYTETECVLPIDGTARVTVFSRETVTDVVFNEQLWEWVDAAPVVGDWEFVSTDIVATDEEECQVPTPTPTPTETVTVTSPPTPSVTPTTPAVTVEQPAAPKLAATGGEGGQIALLGAIFLLAGTAALVIRKRFQKA